MFSLISQHTHREKEYDTMIFLFVSIASTINPKLDTYTHGPVHESKLNDTSIFIYSDLARYILGKAKKSHSRQLLLLLLL